MKKRKTISSSMSSEIQLWTPKKIREPSPSSSRTMDLAIVPSSNDSSFTLPEDWIVEKRRRTSGLLRGNVDTYYHEPGTGRKLRSLISVKRYLTEPGRYVITSSSDIKPKMPLIDARPLSIAFPGDNYQNQSESNVLPSSSSKSHSLMKSLSCTSDNKILGGWRTYIPRYQVNIDRSKPLKLPNGWFIRRIERRSGRSMGRVDKYYCERATGLVFRSKINVLRYLADKYVEENTTLSELFKTAGLIQMSKSEDKDADEEGAMAIVPHSSNYDAYSSISDDVPLKDLVRKYDDVPLKNLVREFDDVPLKDLVRKFNDVPLKDLVRKSNDVPVKDLLGKPDDVPFKDYVKVSDEEPHNNHGRKSDDLPLKYHARECDDMPIKDLLEKSDDAPLEDRARKSDEEPLNGLSRKSDDAPPEDPVQESDDVPLKDLFRKSSVARKNSKRFKKLSSPKNHDSCAATKTSTSIVDVSNQPMKIKWVSSGAGGDAWSPFISDTMVAESMKQEWTQIFNDIFSQKHVEACVTDAED